MLTRPGVRTLAAGLSVLRRWGATLGKSEHRIDSKVERVLDLRYPRCERQVFHAAWSSESGGINPLGEDAAQEIDLCSQVAAPH